MKITGVRTILYEFAMKRSLGDANSPRGRDRSVLLGHEDEAWMDARIRNPPPKA